MTNALFVFFFFSLSLSKVPLHATSPNKNSLEKTWCPSLRLCEFKTLALSLPGTCVLCLISNNGVQERLYFLLKAFSVISAGAGKRIANECVKRMRRTFLLTLFKKINPRRVTWHPTNFHLNTSCPWPMALDFTIKKVFRVLEANFERATLKY